MWLEGKKKKIHCSKEREIGGGQIIYLFIYLFIIVTWKGNLEEKTKLFWGHFFDQKIGIFFGKSVCFPRCKI
jgi:hypothetical protein